MVLKGYLEKRHGKMHSKASKS